MSITKLDRYKGALVGVLAGDALGAPYETWDAGLIRADLEFRGGLVPFDYPNPWPQAQGRICPMGCPTDDSDHTAALAMSLVECRDLDSDDLFRRLRAIVFGKVSPLWDGKVVGSGLTTRNTLRPTSLKESLALPEPDGGWYPSNGSLMRSAPMALFFGSTGEVDDEVVQNMSRVTHRHSRSVAMCLSYVYILCDLLEGVDPFKSVFDEHKYASEEGTLSYPLDNPALDPKDPGQWPERGAADFSYHVALWALLTTGNFRDGITKAVSVGGDTDTYAAIAGGLLGARYGVDAIPQEWRDVLLGRDIMESLASKLYALSH